MASSLTSNTRQKSSNFLQIDLEKLICMVFIFLKRLISCYKPIISLMCWKYVQKYTAFSNMRICWIVPCSVKLHWFFWHIPFINWLNTIHIIHPNIWGFTFCKSSSKLLNFDNKFYSYFSTKIALKPPYINISNFNFQYNCKFHFNL